MVKKVNWTKVFMWVVGIMLPIISIPTIFFVAQNSKQNNHNNKNNYKYLELSSETLNKLHKYLLYCISKVNYLDLKGVNNFEVLKQKIENEITDDINDLCKPIGFVDKTIVKFLSKPDIMSKKEKASVTMQIKENIEVKFDEKNNDFIFDVEKRVLESTHTYYIYYDFMKSTKIGNFQNPNLANRNLLITKPILSGFEKLNIILKKVFLLINNNQMVNSEEVLNSIKAKIVALIDKDKLFNYIDENDKITVDDIEINEIIPLNKTKYIGYNVNLRTSKIKDIPSDVIASYNYNRTTKILNCGNFKSKVVNLNFVSQNENTHHNILVEMIKIINDLLANSHTFKDKNIFANNAKSAMKIYLNELMNKTLKTEHINYVSDVSIEEKKAIIYNETTSNFLVEIKFDDNIKFDSNLPTINNLTFLPTSNTIKVIIVV